MDNVVSNLPVALASEFYPMDKLMPIISLAFMPRRRSTSYEKTRAKLRCPILLTKNGH